MLARPALLRFRRSHRTRSVVGPVLRDVPDVAAGIAAVIPDVRVLASALKDAWRQMLAMRTRTDRHGENDGSLAYGRVLVQASGFLCSVALLCKAAPIQEKPIIVELDGHTFHEKTPEQVAERNDRDRLFQGEGYMVFHFSYLEMTTKPYDCFLTVFGEARCRFEQFPRELFRRG